MHNFELFKYKNVECNFPFVDARRKMVLFLHHFSSFSVLRERKRERKKERERERPPKPEIDVLF